MGGALSLASVALQPDVIDAAAPFYGIPGEDLCNVSTIKRPVQCHFGSLDQLEGFSSPKDAAKLEEKFKAGGVKYEMYIYEGANHAFTNYSGPNYHKESCDLGLKRLCEFMNKNL
jgi:carboxymethylenebutenolidase